MNQHSMCNCGGLGRQGENRHYSISELTLPGFASTGTIKLRYTTCFRPHVSGDVLIRAADREGDLRVIVGDSIEREAGIQLEMVNKSAEHLTFTVLESK